jgi:hypothetical protein
MNENANSKRPTWTVMIYMVADDPSGGEFLDQSANQEIDEIVAAALGPGRGKVNVAVQVDYRNQPDVWRKIVGKGAWVQPEADSADPATLYGFFNFVKAECEADNYLLMFWGHSAGPFGMFADSSSFSYLAQTLTLTELGVALEAAKPKLGKPIDIVVFKDCFMGTLETAFELEGRASFALASQAIVPIDGWPYSDMIKALADQNGKGDPRDAAKSILHALRRFYADPDNFHSSGRVPFALFETAAVNEIRDPLRRLADEMIKESASDTPFSSILSTVRASGRDPGLLDVIALCDGLQNAGLAGSANTTLTLQAGVKQLTSYEEEEVFGKEHFGGVSVYLAPQGEKKGLVAPHAKREVYENLAINKKTEWTRVAFQGVPAPSPSLAPAPSGDKVDPDLRCVADVLERLQRSGFLENLQRKSLASTRQKMGGFAKDFGFSKEAKDLGFIAKDFGFIAKDFGFTAKDFGFLARDLGLCREITGNVSPGGEQEPTSVSPSHTT